MLNLSTKERNEILRELDFLEMGGKDSIEHKNRYIDANAINISLDQPIYRIISLDRFYKMLSNKKNVLVKPVEWDDPFENFLLKSEGALEDGTRLSFKPIRDSFYAQCWTKKKECDGLWRSFKNSKDTVVKLKTTVGKIMEYFYDISNQFHTLSYFIGKVDYVSDKEISQFFKTAVSLNDFKDLGFVKTLLIKRTAFAYEEEVRLIFCKPNSDEIILSEISNEWNNSNYFGFSIDPNNLIDELEIDPWVSTKEFSSIKQEIESSGYTGNIYRSSLYDEPFFKLIIK